MSDHLPEDLWVQVLIRLPIKSILRCSGVSRSWYSLIKTQHFISTHLRRKLRNGAQGSSFLVRDCIAPREEYYEFYSDDLCSLDKFAVFRSPFSVRGMYFQIVGTCNGLLCLSDEDRKCNCNLVLWNPFLQRSVCLPRPNLPNSPDNLRHSLGFGFDPVSNDYKVVRILNMVKDGCDVEIFRLSTHTWENISDNTISNYTYVKPEPAYLDGMVYWIGKSNINGRKIVSFDLGTECFGEMDLPESVARKSNFCCSISVDVYMGSLAIAVAGKSEFCIWILKENDCGESWTKEVSFAFNRNFGWAFGFRENGDIQFMKAFGRWDSFNPIHRKSKLLEVRPFTDSYLLRSFYATPYVESLVFIDKGTDFNDTATLQELLGVYNGESSDPEHSEKSDLELSSSETESESDSESSVE